MNYKDVALLNQSLDDLGGSLLKRRMLDQQASEKMQDQLLQREAIGVANKRTDAQEQHYRTMEGKADTAATMAQTRANLEDKQRFLQTVMALNANGQIQDLAPVNSWLKTDEHFGRVGLQLTKPPPAKNPQAGQNAVAQALQQASEWRAKADASVDNTDLADQYTGYADKLEKWADVQANPPAKVVPERSSITVETQPEGQGGPKVRRSYTNTEYDALQKQRGKPLDRETAAKILAEIKGLGIKDPTAQNAKATELARQRGFYVP